MRSSRRRAAPMRRPDARRCNFARGKLRHDPVFRAIVAHGLVPDGARLVDLGCGQGVLPALPRRCACLLRARRVANRLAAAAPARVGARRDLRRRAIAAARVALRERATVRVGNVRDAEIPQCEVITILDVLHYLPPDDQASVLARCAAGSSPVARCCCGSATPMPACARRSRAFPTRRSPCSAAVGRGSTRAGSRRGSRRSSRRASTSTPRR